LPFEVRVNVTNESPVFWEYYYPLFQEKEGEELMKIWNMDLNIRTGNQISCVAGRTVCSIEANGDVYPCEMFLGEEEMVVGNLRKDSFKKIWATSLLFKEFRKLTKDKINNPCKNCPNEWCGAGCRAAAFSSARSITGCDFHCYYANQN
jgi:radical SAM protein with 4Fe4S-binding SPASM domain